MKNFLAFALVLSCFLFTTIMVGCGPSGCDKKQRIRKARGLMNKTAPSGKTKKTPVGEVKVVPGKTTPAGGDDTSTITTLAAGADEAANKQITDILAAVNNPSFPLANLQEIPEGVFHLSQTYSTVIQTANTYRALLSAKATLDAGDPPKLTLIKETFLANNKSHGGTGPISSALTIPYKVTKDASSQIKLDQLVYYDMTIPSGDMGNILLHDSPGANVAHPLTLLNDSFYSDSAKIFTGDSGAEKGLMVQVRLNGQDELRLVIEFPADSPLYRSFILIYKRSAAAPASDT